MTQDPDQHGLDLFDETASAVRIVARSQQTGGGETPSPLPLLALLPLFLLMRNNDEQPTIRQRQTRRG